ncbi:gfl-1 [Pristionchus pacificus]|uniref:Gfl-1 n=1 Tax=Pristionchus pacificus TaxID=54126 RepID=A0A2A6CBH1_PRIPA|nr:gfl-1 [Pristionchus pacificus]|eukprot:PDM75371.1 gfl-1 [Pristionchus pacificus]
MTETVERAKGKKISKPIVYGNTATPFGYKRESDGHSHQWTVFVKPYHYEDPSLYIRKVQFKLHDSYANPTRVVEKPPFEVTETGWGEFEVQMRIYFVDSNEKPITAFHYIRLFQPIVTLPNGSQQVVSEYYDEIVFQEPTMALYKILNDTSEMKKCDNKRHTNDLVAHKKKSMEAINGARDEINREIEDIKESLMRAHKLLIKYSEDMDDNMSVDTPRESISM